jgi:diguanylate cyclase (GGDEF)-like protein/PAS domain S-box-containing protein
MNTDALESQLYRYAQDLQELMEQQSELQQRYQMVLQSVGRKVPQNDVLASVLMQTQLLHVVTNVHGAVQHMSPDVIAALDLQGVDMRGEPIAYLLADGPDADSDADGFAQVLGKFGQSKGLGGIEQRCLVLVGGAENRFDVLAMQLRKNGILQVLWVLQAAVQGQDGIEIQKSILGTTLAPEGLFLTNPFGTVLAVNPAFESITGYEAAQLVGQNPRLLSSGRHDNTFFQDFWLELLDSGCWNGQMFNRRENGQIFLCWQSVKMVEDESGRVISYMAAVSDLSLRDSKRAKMAQMAYHDPLTGLSNRRLFEDQLGQRIEHARLNNTPLCIMFLDIDGLKTVSDELGYAVGDQVRKALGARLMSLERAELRVAQLGGEEFVLLLTGVLNEQDIEAVGFATLRAMTAQFQVRHHQIVLQANLGCARYPQDGADVATLLKHADAAMYGAKQFDTHFCFYDTGATVETLG